MQGEIISDERGKKVREATGRRKPVNRKREKRVSLPSSGRSTESVKKKITGK